MATPQQQQADATGQPSAPALGIFTYPPDSAEYKGLKLQEMGNENVAGAGVHLKTTRELSFRVSHGFQTSPTRFVIAVGIPRSMAVVQDNIEQLNKFISEEIDSEAKFEAGSYQTASPGAPPINQLDRQYALGRDHYVTFETNTNRYPSTLLDTKLGWLNTRNANGAWAPIPQEGGRTDSALPSISVWKDFAYLGATWTGVASSPSNEQMPGIPMINASANPRNLMAWAYSCMCYNVGSSFKQNKDDQNLDNLGTKTFHLAADEARSLSFMTDRAYQLQNATSIGNPDHYVLSGDGGTIRMKVGPALMAEYSGIAFLTAPMTYKDRSGPITLEQASYFTDEYAATITGVGAPDYSHVIYVPFQNSSNKDPTQPDAPVAKPGDHLQPDIAPPGSEQVQPPFFVSTPNEIDVTANFVVSQKMHEDELIAYTEKPVFHAVVGPPTSQATTLEFVGNRLDRRMATAQNRYLTVETRSPSNNIQRIEIKGMGTKIDVSGDYEIKIYCNAPESIAEDGQFFQMLLHNQTGTSEMYIVNVHGDGNMRVEDSTNMASFFDFTSPTINMGKVSATQIVHPFHFVSHMDRVIYPDDFVTMYVRDRSIGSVRHLTKVQFQGGFLRDLPDSSHVNFTGPEISSITNGNIICKIDAHNLPVGRNEIVLELIVTVQHYLGPVQEKNIILLIQLDTGFESADTSHGFVAPPPDSHASYAPGFFRDLVRQFRATRSPRVQLDILCKAIGLSIWSSNASGIEAAMNRMFDALTKTISIGNGTSVQPKLVELRHQYEERVLATLKGSGAVDGTVNYNNALRMYSIRGHLAGRVREIVQYAAAGDHFLTQPEFSMDVLFIELLLQIVTDAMIEGNKSVEERARANRGDPNVADRPEWGWRAAQAVLAALSALVMNDFIYRNELVALGRRAGPSGIRVNDYIRFAEQFIGRSVSLDQGSQDMVVPRGFITAAERQQQIEAYRGKKMGPLLPYVQSYGGEHALGLSNMRATAGVYNDITDLFARSQIAFPYPTSYPMPAAAKQAGMGSGVPTGPGMGLTNVMQRGNQFGAPQAPPQVPNFSEMKQDFDVDYGATASMIPDFARRPPHWTRPNPRSIEMEAYRKYWDAFHQHAEASKWVPIEKAIVKKRKYKRRKQAEMMDKKFENPDTRRHNPEVRAPIWQIPQDNPHFRMLPQAFRYVHGSARDMDDLKVDKSHIQLLEEALFSKDAYV